MTLVVFDHEDSNFVSFRSIKNGEWKAAHRAPSKVLFDDDPSFGIRDDLGNRCVKRSKEAFT
jgi:hypothetical protein